MTVTDRGAYQLPGGLCGLWLLLICSLRKMLMLVTRCAAEAYEIADKLQERILMSWSATEVAAR